MPLNDNNQWLKKVLPNEFREQAKNRLANRVAKMKAQADEL